MRCKKIVKDNSGRAGEKKFAQLESESKKGSENEYLGPFK